MCQQSHSRLLQQRTQAFIQITKEKMINSIDNVKLYQQFMFRPELFIISLQNLMEPKPKSSSLLKATTISQQTTQKQNKAKLIKGKQIHKKTRITLGVCAVKKKVQSKPMIEILNRLKCPQIQIVQMWQCLDKHESTWPIVDALICFYSQGFPYLMAWRYVNMHNPFLINDLDKQQLLWDRSVIYDILKKNKVPVAKHYFVFRDKKYIDQIQQKGYGKIIPDPQNYINVKKEAQSPERASKVPSVIESQDNRANTLQARYTLPQDIQNKKQEQDKTSKSPKIQRKSHLMNEESIFSKQSVDSRISNPNLPTLLRQFYQHRQPDYYEVQQTQDDFICLKKGDEKIKLKKPFVQKPFDSQNHEICVYYPMQMGGGRKKLFRKIKNSSSNYQKQQNYIRTEGNYVYQQYLPTNAFDIKVYAIGPYYMYAEARKSPTLDGVVQRNKEGKQFRYPVILTPDEKFICSRIVEEFGQQVCGFDLLRANGKSYVCDVNGWSFVKSNVKYWQDCSKILKKKLFTKFFPEKKNEYSYIDKFYKNYQNQYRPPLDNLNPKVQQLRSIVSIFRHGDRSPKLKLKIKTDDKQFINFFTDKNKDQLKLKDAKNLTKALQITIQKIAELDHKDPSLKDFMQMKIVLQSGGHFDGLTRKIQLKVLQRQPNEGGKGAIKKIMIVLKWGGDLSFIGYQDAIELGKKMRMERYDDNNLLSLYASYRHDLKTYASDEGRCIKTAAAFLKGFLSIEGQLAPIISSMVQADDKAQKLLDCTSQQNHSQLADRLCDRLSDIMNRDQSLLTSYMQHCKDNQISDSMVQAIKMIGSPREKLKKLHQTIKELVNDIERIYMQCWQEQQHNQRYSTTSVDQDKCENIMLVSSRWSKLKKDFYDSETDKYNISKIPEIYDTIRHDERKNGLIFNQVDKSIKQNLYRIAKLLAYFIVFNEYGITDQQRIQVGTDICLPLIEKILVDLMFWKQNTSDEYYWKYKNPSQSDNWRHIRTRLYFTSASHMYSLLNILTLGQNRALLKKSPPQEAQRVANIMYMGYLSHIELRLYENLTLELENPNRFRLEMSFSTKFKKSRELRQQNLGGKGFTINEIQEFIQSFIKTKKTNMENKQNQ